jgi:SAM-dependent MidA family methyltransferase
MIVPLARWMEEALYDPDCGYYTSRITTVGARGDFSTTATITPWLGKALWKWIDEELAGHGDAVRDVIEIGAGDGSLMASVLRARGWSWRTRKLRFHVVERSAVLEKRQRSRLAGKSITWHRCMREALAACAGRALVLSNEVIDAFPVVQLCWSGEQWMELCLDTSHNPPVEHLRPALQRLTREDLPDVATWPRPPRAGHRVELHLPCRDWLASWLPQLRTGSLLTIDYGAEFPDLPCGRPGGTLRGYLLHQRIEGPDLYLNKGRQDLTSDVNFSDLQRWGEQLGLVNLPLETQRDFVLRMLPGLGSSRDPAVRVVTHPEGAGTAFKVLRQRKGGGLGESAGQRMQS